MKNETQQRENIRRTLSKLECMLQATLNTEFKADGTVRSREVHTAWNKVEKTLFSCRHQLNKEIINYLIKFF